MKNKLNQIKLLVILVMLLGSVCSCEYNEYVDANLPEQAIYMTSAAVATRAPSATGFYQITSVAIPGQLYKYELDQSANRFNINLGIGRSGATLDGDISVNTLINTDTVSKLIAKGSLTSDVLLLPVTSFTLPPTVKMIQGNTSINFPLSIDLSFLLNNPGKKYAIGVGITSADRRVTSNLSTTIVLLNTAILFPVANFSLAAEAGNLKKINFSNSSTYGIGYSWNFGDGSPLSSERAPSHLYAAPGTYNVTLTTLGITGEAQKSNKVTTITIN